MSKGIKRNLLRAQKRVHEEIRGTASSGGRFASAMSSEGYAGGYSQALSDVLLALNGVRPDTRSYWRDFKGAA